VRALN